MPVREPSTFTVHDVPQVRQLLMLEFIIHKYRTLAI